MPKLAVIALLLSSCTSYEPQWMKEQNAVVASKTDLAAQAMLKCDALFPRLSDSHRLCVMRDIDRLGIQVAEGPAWRSSLPLGPVLPYAYPPLAPRVAVPVVPVR